MKAVISRLGWSGRGALAGRGLRKETVINLRSKSKETSVMAAKDQRHFTKGSGIDTMDIAGPNCQRGERAARCKKEKRKEAAAASASTAPSSSKSAQKKFVSIRNGPLNLLSKRGETGEEEVVTWVARGVKLRRVSALW